MINISSLKEIIILLMIFGFMKIKGFGYIKMT
jgi:hypothetical protein